MSERFFLVRARMQGRLQSGAEYEGGGGRWTIEKEVEDLIFAAGETLHIFRGRETNRINICDDVRGALTEPSRSRVYSNAGELPPVPRSHVNYDLHHGLSYQLPSSYRVSAFTLELRVSVRRFSIVSS